MSVSLRREAHTEKARVVVNGARDEEETARLPDRAAIRRRNRVNLLAMALLLRLRRRSGRRAMGRREMAERNG
jgi:hypothetical protein